MFNVGRCVIVCVFRIGLFAFIWWVGDPAVGATVTSRSSPVGAWNPGFCCNDVAEAAGVCSLRLAHR